MFGYRPDGHPIPEYVDPIVQFTPFIMTTRNDNRRTYNQQSSISFAGSNFYINDRQDAYALAVEIASLTRRQQRGRGLRMA